MAQFAVLVVGDDPEKQLSPFGDLTDNNLDFVETELDCRKQFENETATMVKLPNGEYVTNWSEAAKNLKIYNSSLYTEVQIPVNHLYKSFEDYIKDYHGYEIDSKTGKYGYWTNLNKKWNQRVLGGRWRGSFKLKPDASGVLGFPGVFDIDVKEGYVDSAKKGDIDWNGMLSDNMKDGEKAKRFWELLVDGEQPQGPSDLKILNGAFYKRDYYLNVYINKENYVRARVEFHTWAVLKDNKWNECGEMGWQESFYDKWIQDLPDETLLSVYDCHV